MTEGTKLQDLFHDWVDTDEALYYIAGILGIMDLDTSHEAWVRVKGVFNTRNPISDSMWVICQELIKLGVLEETDVGLIRWNASNPNIRHDAV